MELPRVWLKAYRTLVTNNYREAIHSLKARCDRPRVIYQLHVRKICEVPNLKDGRFHDDVIQQHSRQWKKTPLVSYLPFGVETGQGHHVWMAEGQSRDREDPSLQWSPQVPQPLCAGFGNVFKWAKDYLQKKTFPYKAVTTFAANRMRQNLLPLARFVRLWNIPCMLVLNLRC